MHSAAPQVSSEQFVKRQSLLDSLGACLRKGQAHVWNRRFPTQSCLQPRIGTQARTQRGRDKHLRKAGRRKFVNTWRRKVSTTISPQDVDVRIAWRTGRAAARLFAAQPALGDEAFAAIRAESLHSALGVPRGLPAAAADNAAASPAPALPSPHAAQQLSVLRRAAAGRTPATVGDEPIVVEPRAHSLFLYF